MQRRSNTYTTQPSLCSRPDSRARSPAPPAPASSLLHLVDVVSVHTQATLRVHRQLFIHVTTGLPRTVSHNCAYVRCAWRRRDGSPAPPLRVVIVNPNGLCSSPAISRRQSVAFIQQHREGHRLRPLAARRRRPSASDVCSGWRPCTRPGSRCSVHVMSKLARAAAARQLFLLLPRQRSRLALRRCQCVRRRQPRLIHLVYMSRRADARAVLRAPLFSARPLRLASRCLAKRRRLPGAVAPRRFEFLFQFLVLAAQPLPLRFHRRILAQSLDLTGLLLDDLLLVASLRLFAAYHATFMPNPLSKYKYSNFGFLLLTR